MEEAAIHRLVGTWDATFTRIGPDGRDDPDAIHGTIALVQDSYGHVETAQLTTADEIGVYDVDFRPFGFDPREGGGIPTLLATVTADSSDETPTEHVRMVLHPGDTRVAVVLDGILTHDGMLTHDAITGSWQTDSRTASGSGHFTLTRHEP